MAESPLKRVTEVCYVALDPGETTGYATFSDLGELIECGQFKLADQTKWLTELITNTPNLKVVIIEEYVNYGWKQQKRWSKNQTSKNIGKAEILCEIRNPPVKYIRQGAQIKPIGYKWAGLKQAPSNHSISHQYDAVAHGVYWLIVNKIRNAIHAVPEGER